MNVLVFPAGRKEQKAILEFVAIRSYILFELLLQKARQIPFECYLDLFLFRLEGQYRIILIEIFLPECNCFTDPDSQVHHDLQTHAHGFAWMLRDILLNALEFARSDVLDVFGFPSQRIASNSIRMSYLKRIFRYKPEFFQVSPEKWTSPQGFEFDFVVLFFVSVVERSECHASFVRAF